MEESSCFSDRSLDLVVSLVFGSGTLCSNESGGDANESGKEDECDGGGDDGGCSGGDEVGGGSGSDEGGGGGDEDGGVGGGDVAGDASSGDEDGRGCGGEVGGDDDSSGGGRDDNGSGGGGDGGGEVVGRGGESNSAIDAVVDPTATGVMPAASSEASLHLPLPSISAEDISSEILSDISVDKELSSPLAVDEKSPFALSVGFLSKLFPLISDTITTLLLSILPLS